MIIDAWAQHPTLRHMADPMFESLRRWGKGDIPSQAFPVAMTVKSMDAANVSQSLISAWAAPGKAMISNEEVGGFDGPHRD